MADIRLLQGPDVRETLREEGELAVFRYRLNKPVYSVAMVIGAALLALGGFVWWTYELTALRWVLAASIPAVAGLAVGAVAAYWYYFSETHFVAMSDEHVYVGAREEMWCIDWTLLDRDSLGFEEMSLSSVGGTLNLDVAGQEIPLRLYSAFVQLENLQGFMYKILQHLRDESTLSDDHDESEELSEAEEGLL